jgi:hypothetical protein
MQPSHVKQNDGYDYAKVVSLVPYGRLRYNPFFWTAFCTVLEQFHIIQCCEICELSQDLVSDTDI